MRQPATFPHVKQTCLCRGRAIVLAAMLGIGGVAAPGAFAQDATPGATPSAATPAAVQEAAVTTLMEASFEDFPPAPMTVRMLRITLDPGASTPMHTHPGPEFDRIESGSLTVRTQGEAPVTRTNGDEETSTGEDIVLSAGDSIMFPADVGMYYINDGDEPVEMLSAVLLPVGTAYPQSITYTDGQPTSDEFLGVSFVVLGDGLIQNMPGGPVTVSINEVTVPAGGDLPATEGIAMYSAIDGNFSFIVDEGMVQVSRSELESLQPNAVAGEEFILEEGDAAFFPAGVGPTSRADESGEMKMLTLEILFQEPLESEPAALTFTSGASASGDATGGPETAEVADDAAADGVIGQIGTTNAEGINLRAEPSTSADIVDQINSGIEVEVVDGPVDAEDFTWYEVQVNVEGGSRGWMVAEFVDGITAQPAATEAAAATAPASTPAADAGAAEFASGDTVQLTDDTVRVRSEGNLGGEIVNTFDAGTQFQITGEPVVADGFTWYPVTLVDDPSITGWVTVDFLEPAP